MSRILVIMLMLTTYAMASETGHEGSDILQRSVNFVIFVGLVWYLIAEPVRNYFTSRSKGIADELQKVQNRLNESIALKKEALGKISEAEKFAEELKEASRKENKLLNDAIMSQCEIDLDILSAHQTSLMEFEQRRMVRKVVEETLDTVLTQSSEDFDKEAMANVILKKVA